MELVLFYIFGGLTVLGALFMVVRRNPLDGAFSLIVGLCALAGLYAMLHAEFVFILQVLLYAGAIMVIIMFTIMLLNLNKEELKEPPVGIVKFSVVLAAVLLGLYAFLSTLSRLPVKDSFVAPTFGNLDKVGQLMLSAYMYPFEVISAVLLVAIVGVVLLAKKVI
jgi:NADH-quinone oxidoreductase subunit J